jgi:putative tryptophan/tyrosine transport system substrate-binding protein
MAIGLPTNLSEAEMRRREFIAGLGGAVAWPLGALAQQPTMPAVGYLEPYLPEASEPYRMAFRRGLGEMSYIEGRNVAVEYHSSMTISARTRELAAELVRRPVAVIVAASGNGALAAKAVTSAIPIVFVSGADPVVMGLVSSLNRPGGNVTGISSLGVELGSKRFALLHELVPRATHLAMLVDPLTPLATSRFEETRVAAASVGVEIEAFTARTEREIDAAFEGLVQKCSEALVVAQAASLESHAAQISRLAEHHRLPAIYAQREFVRAGGLMSYGTNWEDLYRQAGVYTGRILKGQKPADLPVIQATTFELVINLQTARKLGIEVPATLLASADAVIE